MTYFLIDRNTDPSVISWAKKVRVTFELFFREHQTCDSSLYKMSPEHSAPTFRDSILEHMSVNQRETTRSEHATDPRKNWYFVKPQADR